MTEDTSIQLSLFVEHGRELEAANFYEAAFGAREVDTYTIDGVLAGVAMRFWRAGRDGRRLQSEPGKDALLWQPFFPKQAGAVSTILQVNVGDIDAAFPRAIAAGAVIRDEVQTDALGRRIASIFDPFGHIWAIVERKATTASLAA